MTFLRIVIPLYLLFEHDLFGKPVPTFPDHAQKFDSGGFLQNFGEALLDRLGRFGRDFLSELPKFPVLRGRGLEAIAALRG
jgi:hypothetical protein